MSGDIIRAAYLSLPASSETRQASAQEAPALMLSDLEQGVTDTHLVDDCVGDVDLEALQAHHSLLQAVSH